MGKYLRASLGFWILLVYVVALSGHIGWQAFGGAEKKRELRGFYLQHALRVSKPLLRDGRTRELSVYLREATERGMIDFYELELLGKPTEKGGMLPEKRPVLTEAVSEAEGAVWGKAETSDASLRIGAGTGWRARLREALRQEADRLPADVAFLALALFLSVFFQGRMRRSAKQSATTVVRQGRRAKVLRTERASGGPETMNGEAVFGRVALLTKDYAVTRLEPFFTDCAALISRYGGKLGSLHGHELLFVFFEGDPSHQTRLALALLRDLEDLATAEGFELASSLAFGSITGAQIVPGSPTLFGAPVTETGELLRAQIQQRKAGQRHAESIARLGGNKNDRGLEKTLSECRAGNSSELAYHRSDTAIEIVLLSLAANNWTPEAYVATMSELRRVECKRCGPGVVEAFRQLLAIELGGKDSYRLSGTLALAPHLLNRSLVDKDLERMFLEAVKVKDRRVRANAVELFTRFFPEREIPELRSLLRDEDNRVCANALIKAACERFDEKVIAKVEERVKGGSVAHVASALHAMGEIAAYYKKMDPLFLGTKLAFLRLFDGVPAWAQHPNPMIRRQALIAAQKLGCPSLNESLAHLYSHTSDPELLSLFASVYGWRRGGKSKVA